MEVLWKALVSIHRVTNWFSLHELACSFSQDSRAAEASKLLKGVDGIALHLAKTAVASNAIVSEASNVGEYHSSYLHTNSVWGAIFGGKRNEKLFLILITRPCDSQYFTL